MEYINILLKLFIVFCFYISLKAYGHDQESSCKINIDYCLDKKINKSNIEIGLKMISDHSCFGFTRKSNCDDKKECMKVCRKKCRKCKTKCIYKCKKLSPPFIRFLYDGKNSISGYYFNGSIDLMKTKVFDMKIEINCNKKPGCIAKKVMMYLGLLPNVRRADREFYVHINLNNIQEKYRREYTKLFDVDLYMDYDMASIAQFPQTYRKLNSNATFTRIQPNDERLTFIGQEIRPTFSDLKFLYFVHCRNVCTTTVKCKHGSYPKSNNKEECECPTGYTGKFCDQLQYKEDKCPQGFLSLKEEYKEHILYFNSTRKCTVQVKANEGQQLRIIVKETNCANKNPCFENDCLQVKYHEDMSLTGLLICGKNDKQFEMSTLSNMGLIQYTGKHANHSARIVVFSYTDYSRNNLVGL